MVSWAYRGVSRGAGASGFEDEGFVTYRAVHGFARLHCAATIKTPKTSAQYHIEETLGYPPHQEGGWELLLAKMICEPKTEICNVSHSLYHYEIMGIRNAPNRTAAFGAMRPRLPVGY